MRPPIDTPDDVLNRIKPGDWVLDAKDNPWCLMNTHVMVEQVMWKAGRANHYVALDGIPFPIFEAEFDGECEHKRTQERGHCTRCGQVVGDPDAWKQSTFGLGLPPGLTGAQRIAVTNQIAATLRDLTRD